jgi:hypothetical protein
MIKGVSLLCPRKKITYSGVEILIRPPRCGYNLMADQHSKPDSLQ